MRKRKTILIQGRKFLDWKKMRYTKKTQTVSIGEPETQNPIRTIVQSSLYHRPYIK